MHVPKTGSSFANALYRTACRDYIPDWAYVRTVGVPDPDFGIATYFASCFPSQMEKCWDVGVLHHGAHESLTTWTPKTAAYVTMLREPLQRVVSGYHHDQHDCNECKKHGFSLFQYAKSREIQGMYTKMILGIGRAKSVNQEDLDVSTALQRLEQFAFVGLTSDWDNSVCVFHYLFGGEPFESEFLNVRPGGGDKKFKLDKSEYQSEARPSYDTTELHDQLKAAGALDLADTRIYNLAVSLFETNFKAYQSAPTIKASAADSGSGSYAGMGSAQSQSGIFESGKLFPAAKGPSKSTPNIISGPQSGHNLGPKSGPRGHDDAVTEKGLNESLGGSMNTPIDQLAIEDIEQVENNTSEANVMNDSHPRAGDMGNCEF